jgi:flagellar motor protein MotB
LTLSGCTKLICKRQIQENKGLQSALSVMETRVGKREAERDAWKDEADLVSAENVKLQAGLREAVGARLALEARAVDVSVLLDKKEAERERLQKLIDLWGGQGGMETRLDPEGVILLLKNKILFDPGKIELKDEARNALGKTIVTVLRENPAQNIRIYGHTDGVPITASRWDDLHHLSAMRAHVVMKHLASKGISPRRMHIAGMGPNVPVVQPAKPKDDVPENRRVEILLLSESGRSLLGDIIEAFE